MEPNPYLTNDKPSSINTNSQSLYAEHTRILRLNSFLEAKDPADVQAFKSKYVALAGKDENVGIDAIQIEIN